MRLFIAAMIAGSLVFAHSVAAQENANWHYVNGKDDFSDAKVITATTQSTNDNAADLIWSVSPSNTIDLRLLNDEFRCRGQITLCNAQVRFDDGPIENVMLINYKPGVYNQSSFAPVVDFEAKVKLAHRVRVRVTTVLNGDVNYDFNVSDLDLGKLYIE